MLTLYGVAVTAENARHIVASLFADGSPPQCQPPRLSRKVSTATCTQWR
jgi:hypothetical protein